MYVLVLRIHSSIITFTLCTEYGPPLVELNCSNEASASMHSMPTGSLSLQEFEDKGFISRCDASWNCTNGTGYLQRDDISFVRN